LAQLSDIFKQVDPNKSMLRRKRLVAERRRRRECRVWKRICMTV